jgi:nucleoside-diphosphate-sugar epimerase
MRVFVTGATGFIASAIVRELLEAGHQVVGLARSDTAAATLTAAGAEVHRGALDDLDSLRSGGAAADGVIHAAFNNLSETTDFAAAVQTDRRAVGAIGAALDSSGKPFVVASGTMVVTPGRLATEEDPGRPECPGSRRRTRRSPLQSAGYARRSCGLPRPCTARATRQASFRA